MSHRTVLVVDPASQTAARVQEALVGLGFRVLSATSPEQGEARLEQDEVDCVLSALNFPRGNGYDFARAVRARRPEAVVFLLCGGFDVYNAPRAVEAGVAARIARPFSADALRRQLESAFGPLTVEAQPAPAPVSGPDEYDGPILAAVEPEAAARPAPADERVATFVPRDWHVHPPVRVDPEQLAPALERLILEMLPGVLEAVLHKALVTSPGFRDLLEVAAEDAVRAHLPGLARRIVLERLAELEAGGNRPT